MRSGLVPRYTELYRNDGLVSFYSNPQVAIDEAAPDEMVRIYNEDDTFMDVWGMALQIFKTSRVDFRKDLELLHA